MSKDLIELNTESHAGIATLTLNRPDARNALSLDMLAALQIAIATVSAQDETKAVILAANGSGYCAGHDLNEMTAHRADGDRGKAYYDELFSSCSKVMISIVESPKIFIAKVHAPAVAAGCQLVASCDMVVTSDAAKFGVTGINSGLFCSTPMVALSRAIGPKKSMELLTTGSLLSADNAKSAGLVNHVVDASELDDTALKMANMIAAKPAHVLALGKTAFYKQRSMDLGDAYAFTSDVIVNNLMRSEAEEGIAAFLEKRTPKWD